MDAYLDSEQKIKYGLYRTPPLRLPAQVPQVYVIAGWVADPGENVTLSIVINGRQQRPDYAFHVPAPIDGIACFGTTLLPGRLHFLHLIRGDHITDGSLEIGLSIDEGINTPSRTVHTSEVVKSAAGKPRGIATEIGVILPVYRPPRHLLERQLSSLLDQTHQNHTVWIGDEGADARTSTLLITTCNASSRLAYIPRDHRVGHYAHFEKLLSEAQGKHTRIALCDHDDYWQPEKLQRLSERYGKGVSYSDMHIVNTSGQRLHDTIWQHRTRYAHDPLALSITNVISGCSMMIDDAMLDLLLPFPVDLGAAKHDHWIAFAASCHGRLDYVDEKLMDYTHHETNVVGFRPMRKASYVRGLLRRASFRRMLRHRADATSARFVAFLKTHLKNYFDQYLQRRLMYLTFTMRSDQIIHHDLDALYGRHDARGLLTFHKKAARKGWRTDDRPLSFYHAMTVIETLNIYPIKPLTA